MPLSLADLMESKGIGKYKLSDDSGIPWATPSDIFNGKTDPDGCEAGTLRKLPQMLGMTMEEILDFSDRLTDGRSPSP